MADVEVRAHDGRRQRQQPQRRRLHLHRQDTRRFDTERCAARRHAGERGLETAVSEQPRRHARESRRPARVHQRHHRARAVDPDGSCWPGHAGRLHQRGEPDPRAPVLAAARDVDAPGAWRSARALDRVPAGREWHHRSDRRRAGVAIAFGCIRLLHWMRPAQLPRIDAIEVDIPVLAICRSPAPCSRRSLPGLDRRSWRRART